MKGGLYDIDKEKLKALVKSWGGATAVAYKSGLSYDTVLKSIRRRSVSQFFIKKIEAQYKVPYEMYKKIEEEPEKVEPIEEVQTRIELPTITNEDIKGIACLLREICNNHNAMYKRLNHLTGICTRMEDEIIKMREKVEKL